MDRSGVLIVIVGCVLLAAGGTLVTLKNGQQRATAHLETDEQHAPTRPEENSDFGGVTPTIEPIPPPAAPIAAIPSEPSDNVIDDKRLATGSGTTKTVGSGDEEKTAVAGDMSDPQSVVASMRPDFRRCYTDGLKTNPNMKGTLRIITRIGPDGKVAVANSSGGNGLSKEVIECLVRRVKKAQFSPPTGGGATIVIPVSFS